MRLTALITSLVTVVSVSAAEVVQVTWPTTHAAQPVRLEAPASSLLPAFRLAIQTLPESSIVNLALAQPSLLGLTSEQARLLQPLVAERYRLLAQSPAYAKATSSLPYCYGEQKPATGLASVYVPAGASAATPSIVFLHGFGGSFLWYQHYLSESFSNHIIICPAYGISPAQIPQAYVAESIRAVSNRLGFSISTPKLIGLSAGGFGACQVYVSAPQAYSQMICLGAFPPEATLSRFGNDARPRFPVGAVEPYVASGDFTKRLNRVRQTCPGAEAVVISGADHFFLLSHQEESLKQLRRWLSADGETASPARR